MTDQARPVRGLVALALVPLTAGLFGVGLTWAESNDPTATSDPAPVPTVTVDPRVTELEAQVADAQVRVAALQTVLSERAAADAAAQASAAADAAAQAIGGGGLPAASSGGPGRVGEGFSRLRGARPGRGPARRWPGPPLTRDPHQVQQRPRPPRQRPRPLPAPPPPVDTVTKASG